MAYRKVNMADSIKVDIKTPAKELIPINEGLGKFVTNGISAIILAAALGTFIFLVYGGVEWIISGGDKEKIQKAKDKITNAIIGLALVSASWAIYLIIDYFFGIGIAQP